MKYENTTVLVVAPDFPYPAHHGGLVDIWRRIIALRRLGFKVDLLATVKCNPAREHLDYVKAHVDHVYLAMRSSHLKSIFSFGPSQIALRKSIYKIRLDRCYDYAVVETEFGGGIFENPSFESRKTILRVQNDEARYLRAAATTEPSLRKRLYYTVESWKSRSYSQMLAQRVDMIWFISATEHQQFLRSFSTRPDLAAKAFVLPAPVETYEGRSRLSEKKQVLFLGNLFTPLNRDALRWYVEDVHPRLMDVPGYKFVIAGSTQGKSTQWLRQMTSGFTNVELHCDVSDPQSLYASSSVFVNPMLAGAGVKLKTINAIEAGLPVVTTAVGIEGTGLEDGIHVSVANDPLTFSSKVRLLLECNDVAASMISSSQRFLSQNYDHAALLAELFSKLEKVGVQRGELAGTGK